MRESEPESKASSVRLTRQQDSRAAIPARKGLCPIIGDMPVTPIAFNPPRSRHAGRTTGTAYPNRQCKQNLQNRASGKIGRLGQKSEHFCQNFWRSVGGDGIDLDGSRPPRTAVVLVRHGGCLSCIVGWLTLVSASVPPAPTRSVRRQSIGDRRCRCPVPTLRGGVGGSARRWDGSHGISPATLPRLPPVALTVM